jgi:hypothetical protein
MRAFLVEHGAMRSVQPVLRFWEDSDLRDDNDNKRGRASILLLTIRTNNEIPPPYLSGDVRPARGGKSQLQDEA